MKKSIALTFALACLAGVSFAAEKKRVVVCTVTTGFRHAPAIAEAEKTLPKLAKESGAFEIVEFVRQPEAGGGRGLLRAGQLDPHVMEVTLNHG